MANNAFVNYQTRRNFVTTGRREIPGLPLFGENEKILPMKDKVALFFIRHGCYRITSKAESLLEVQKALSTRNRVIHEETYDSNLSHLKDESEGGLAYFSPKEKKKMIAETVGQMVLNGKGSELLGENAITIRAPDGYWSDMQNRVFWIRELASSLKKDPRDLAYYDFLDNQLTGLINHYGGSPYKAVSDAFPELGIWEWEMAATPRNFFDSKEHRVAATKWLVEKLGKDPRDLNKQDFLNNRLCGLLDHYGNSPYKAVHEAYPELELKPDDMRTRPRAI